jgi:predicted transposase/invertase (TIGR01784 family)
MNCNEGMAGCASDYSIPCGGDWMNGLLEDGRSVPSEATKHRFANIMMDYWFKRTFGMPGRSRLLLLLLKELIPERDIREISYLPTEHLNPIPGMKDIRIDVECTDQDGARFIVEMQVVKQKHFADRVVYYSACALMSQLEKGEPEEEESSGPRYYDYPPVFMISLIDFSIHPDSDEVLYRYDVRSKDGKEQMSDKLNYIFLELPNCKNALTGKATLLDNFCYAMRQMQFLDRRPPELKAEIFELLFESANISKFTPEEKLKYDKDMTTERDRRNQLATSFSDGKDEGLAEGKAEGIAEGMEKGKTEGRIETARNLLKLGVSIDVVSKGTGLSIEELKRLG